MLNALVGDGAELDIIERTQGNPFFIEEMLLALFSEGALMRNGTVKLARPLAQLLLPATVQGLLAARIDRQRESINNCSRLWRCWARSRRLT